MFPWTALIRRLMGEHPIQMQELVVPVLRVLERHLDRRISLQLETLEIANVFITDRHAT
jgi:hypothetical protein